MFAFDRVKAMRLFELVAVLVLAQSFATWVEAAATLLHFDFPEMPLLKRTYLFFSLVLLLCLYIRLKGETLAEFGFVRPASWGRTMLRALLLFVISMGFDAVVRPMLDPVIASLTHTSPHLAEQHFAALKGNLPLLLFVIPFGWIFGGFGEEILYRGFVMTRIAQVLGEGRAAWVAAVLLQAVPFAIGHSYQGPVGMTSIYIGAVITGAATVFWKRNLWPAMIAHGLVDTFGFTALYAGMT